MNLFWLSEASRLTQALDFPLLNMIATPILVEMYEAQGELHKVARLYQQPLQVLHSTKEAPPELAAWLYTAYAKLLREQRVSADQHDAWLAAHLREAPTCFAAHQRGARAGAQPA